MKWIKAIESQSEEALKRKTKTWRILTLDDVSLGLVLFFPKWRKFVYQPHGSTLYEETCLRDIASFCEEQTKAWKLEVKSRKVSR